MYYAVQFLTFGILILAANTSYQGFPRLAAVLARDRYFPRQFVNLGDRLVYSNGIIVLAAVAALLIWIFHADVIALIHLYVIGVFTAFTLSQAGMVQHWRTTEGASLAPPRRHQRPRCGDDRARDAARDPGEVRRGRVDGDDRGAAAHPRVPRDQPPLPGRGSAAAGRHGRRALEPVP